MAAQKPQAEEAVLLLKQLVAIELWRAGLSQKEIKSRLGIGSATVTELLKGVSREVDVRVKRTD